MKKILFQILILLAFLPVCISAQTPAEIWLSYADKLFAAQQFQKALAGYDKVLGIEPDNYEANLRKGLCYYSLKDTQGAIFWLEKASAIKPSEKVSKFISQLKNTPLNETSNRFLTSGGSARLYSLAGASIALPDMQSVMDMYSKGFTSSYLQRPAHTYINLSPGLVFGEDARTYTTTAMYTDTNFEISANNNSSAIWFSPDNVLTLNPSFSRSGEIRKNYNPYILPDSYTIDITDTKWVVDAGYAHRINPSLSLGLAAGYNNLLHIEDSRLDPGMTGRSDVDVQKLSWLLSTTYLIKNNSDTISLCAAAGSMIPHSRYEAIDTLGSYYEYSVIGRSGYEMKVLTEDSNIRFNSSQNYNVTAYDAWLGAGYVNPGLFDITAKIFYTPYIKITQKILSTLLIKAINTVNTLDDYERVVTDKMGTAGIDASGRLYTQWLTVGAGIRTDYIYGKHEPEMGNTVDARTSILEWSAGVNVTALKNFNFPMQFYYSSSQAKDVGTYDTSYSAVETFGYKAGAEYLPDKNLSFRAGIKYLYGGSVNTLGPSDYAFESALTYGSAINPATIVTGYYAGAGYVLGQWEFNLAVGTESKKYSPRPENTLSYKNDKTSMMLDVRYNF